MEAFDSLYKAFAEHPAVAMLVLTLLALAWLGKRVFTREAEFAAEKDAITGARIREIQEANAAHLQTALQVAPLASKLVTCVEVLERLSNAALSRSNQ